MHIKKSLSCTILPPPVHYEVIIGENLIPSALKNAKHISSQVLIVTTDVVHRIVPIPHNELLILPSTESIKSRAIKEKIEDALIKRGWGKECCLVAIGGGAVLDLVGFVCATYCRGISYVSVPTTLIAMTDAAIGGKTAVNVEEAKNWIGAFHHPHSVYIDLNLLKTLSDKDYVYGLAETIKHSLIGDADFFTFLEKHREDILKRQAGILQEMVWRSCSIKKTVVERDPYEKIGYRRILNFGHTIGHAIETLSQYRYSHGQAVVMGMLVEAEMACFMNFLSHSCLQRIKTFIKKFPFKMDYPKNLPFEMLKRDKKGAYHFVVLTDIGKVASCEGNYVLPFSKDDLEKAWQHVVCDNS